MHTECSQTYPATSFYAAKNCIYARVLQYVRRLVSGGSSGEEGCGQTAGFGAIVKVKSVGENRKNWDEYNKESLRTGEVVYVHAQGKEAAARHRQNGHNRPDIPFPGSLSLIGPSCSIHTAWVSARNAHLATPLFVCLPSPITVHHNTTWLATLRFTAYTRRSKDGVGSAHMRARATLAEATRGKMTTGIDWRPRYARKVVMLCVHHRLSLYKSSPVPRLPMRSRRPDIGSQARSDYEHC